MKRTGFDHPKVRRLGSLLGIRHFEAVGILECLWNFTARHAICGDVGKWSDGEIAAAIGWPTERAEDLIMALRSARLIDSSRRHRLVIHDWAEHADDSTRKTVKKKGWSFAIAGDSLTDGAGAPHSPLENDTFEQECEPDSGDASGLNSRSRIQSSLGATPPFPAIRQCDGDLEPQTLDLNAMTRHPLLGNGVGLGSKDCPSSLSDEAVPSRNGSGEITNGSRKVANGSGLFRNFPDSQSQSQSQSLSADGETTPVNERAACDTVYVAVAEDMWNTIRTMNPTAREPDLKKWASELRIMCQRDGPDRTPEGVRGLFIWANQDAFWRTNILSPGSLRKHWDQLVIKRSANGGCNQQHRQRSGRSSTGGNVNF